MSGDITVSFRLWRGRRVKWTKPRTLRTVDPGVVINSGQARRFVAAVGSQGPRGERLTAFLGCMYYAALRPEEVIDLRREENLISLPARGWGELRLTHSRPRSGTRWTDSGKSRERRELKHRALGETRLVPVHPELVTLLRDHIERFGRGPGGRIHPYVASRTTFGFTPAKAICARSSAGLLAILTVPRRRPSSVIRTSTERRRCRSMPTT